MTSQRKEKILYGAMSLLFSLVLFFNANGQTVSKLLATENNYEELVQNVPITVSYDSDKYYVHGYVSTASVKLSSANRVQLNGEMNADTRSFKLTADLKNKGVGTYEVPVKVENLSSAVTGTPDPATITVTIEKKTTQTMTVEPVLSGSATSDGLEVENPTADPAEVKITTGEETLQQIDKIVARVSADSFSLSTDTVEAKIQALDTNGDALNVTAEPNTVAVKADVVAESKEVGLTPVQSGTAADSVRSYTFRLSDSRVELKGTAAALEDVEELELPITVTGITQSTVKTVKIPAPAGLSAHPSTVTVTITPIFYTNTTDSSEETTDTTDTDSTSSSSVVKPSSDTSESSVESSQQSSETVSSTSSSEEQAAASSIESHLEEQGEN